MLAAENSAGKLPAKLYITAIMSLKRSAAKAGNPQKASHEIQLSGFAAVSDVNGLSNSYYAAGIK